MPTVELSYRGGHRRDGERFYIDRLLPEIWIPDHDLPLVTVEDPDLGPVETFASRRFRRRTGCKLIEGGTRAIWVYREVEE